MNAEVIVFERGGKKKIALAAVRPERASFV